MESSSLRGERLMSSSISHFREWIAATVFLVAIEATVYARFKPNEFDRTNLLQFAFAKEETSQRVFVHLKMKEFADSSPTIVQSGDSSGFHGIVPRVVER